MVKDSTDHGQAMCRWFAHPLGVFKSTHPLNSLFRLETWHSGPNLGLIHPESNWNNVENAVDALQVQLDLNTSNGGNNRSTKSICHSRIESMHRSRENQLQNHHYGPPTHWTKEALKPKMSQLGEINTSPWNHFPLSELLLVPLIILYGTKESRVKPRLSASLHLSRLRWLSKALALCPRGSCFSSRSHQKNKNERDEAGRERYKHNQEKMNPIKSPRRAKMEKKSIVMRGSTPKLKP